MTKPPFSRVTPAFVLTALCLMATCDAAAQNVPAAIAFVARHAVALRSNGEVLTWGENLACHLGPGGGNATATPGLVLRNATAVAAAADNTLALTFDLIHLRICRHQRHRDPLLGHHLIRRGPYLRAAGITDLRSSGFLEGYVRVKCGKHFFPLTGRALQARYSY